MQNILITGATGFIGAHLTTFLAKKGYKILACSRRFPVYKDELTKDYEIKHCLWDMGKETPPTYLTENIDCVINLASCLNGSDDTMKNINVTATQKLFEAAISNGSLLFIQMSTAKVYGETSDGEIFTEAHSCKPRTPYAASKFEAEIGLQRITRSHNERTKLTILRPPLVYGTGAKGNIARLIQWIEKGIPLPFASINNKRSFIAVDNLCDALLTCLQKHELSSGIFNVTDCHDISTTELIKFISIETKKKARLLPFPCKILHKTLKALYGNEITDRLLASFQLDSRLFCQHFAWQPPYDYKTKLAETGLWYQNAIDNDMKG